MPDSGFDIIQSNRTENLAGRLCEDLSKAPLFSPFTREIILVQDPSVGRWLEMFVARKTGIAANIRFLNPPQFVADLYRTLDPSLRSGSPYDPDVLRWKIFPILEDRRFTAKFPELSGYLRNGDRGKTFDLAAKIAEIFSRYLVYRMDWLAAWEAGKEGSHGRDELWQAALWRSVREGTPEPHHGMLFGELIGAIGEGRLPLPERISVFGISSLSPAYAALLQTAGKHSAVALYVMNPCREEWGEIASERQIAEIEFSPELLHFEAPHALLGSLGKQGRDFMGIVYEREGEGYGTTYLFETPGDDSLLHFLQTGIVNLKEGRYSPRADDFSVQVHRCHTPMREVQVLRDRLLDLFEKDPTLRPSDIMVLAPDINVYAPYVDAVFSPHPGERLAIPVEIADRTPAQMDPVVEAWLALLELPRTRFEADTVVGLLRLAPLAAAFSIPSEYLDKISQWVESSGIRWGLDGRHKSALGLPSDEVFSWSWGLDRLTLGVALPKSPDALFHGYLPCDLVEGEDVDLLDRFLRFVGTLKEWTEFLTTPRTMEEWGVLLNGWLDRLFPGGKEVSEQREELRDAIAAAIAGSARASYSGPVDYSVMRRILLDAVAEDRQGLRFLSGGVVFCSMRPMRALPFRVICLLGLSDGEFPRERHSTSFDLMRRYYRHGDRSGRQDDRYLFLELLLSAREKFLVSYVGEDVFSGKNLPPSPILSELLDFIGRVAYAVPADGSDKRTPRERAEAAILVRHPLQSFSPKYFDGREPSLFSYSDADRHACLAIRSGQTEEVVLFPEPLPTESVRRVSLDELCRFVRNPARYLFNKRLGISYWSEEDILEGDEPLVVGKAEARSIRKALVEGMGRGVAAADERTVFARLSADARLPVGLPGRTGFRGEVRQMSPVLEAGRLLLENERIPALAGTLRIGGWELDVEIASGLTTDGYFEVQAGSLKGKEILPFWAKYLAVSLLHPHAGDLSGSLLGIGEDRKKEELRPDLLTFRRDDAAREVLQDLLGWYEVGLTRPIRLFPNSCWEYALGFGAEKNVSTAMEKAERAWVASDWGRGESQDDYFSRVFPSDASALDDEFRLLAGKLAVRAFSSLAGGPKPPKKGKQGKEDNTAKAGKVGNVVKVGKGGKKG